LSNSTPAAAAAAAAAYDVCAPLLTCYLCLCELKPLLLPKPFLVLLQRASAEDFDEEEQEALAAENEQEEELYDQVRHSSACFVTMLLSVHGGCQGSGVLRPGGVFHSMVAGVVECGDSC
jgi:hypothetical protein